MAKHKQQEGLRKKKQPLYVKIFIALFAGIIFGVHTEFYGWGRESGYQ